MAKSGTMSDESLKRFLDSIQELPPEKREIFLRYPPDRLYRLKETGERGVIQSYDSDNTVTVAITGQFNRTIFGRAVFGIKLDSIEECDLPEPHEQLGEILTDQEDIDAFVKAKRADMFGRDN